MATIDFENTKILYKNFSGAKSEWNRNGTRTASIVIDDPEVAKILAEDGWNVKVRKDEDGEIQCYYIETVINFHPPFGEPPTITMRMVDKNGKLISRTTLNENTVSTLDKLRIIDADVRLNAHEWNVQGKRGIKGYVDMMIVNVLEDPFVTKYAEEEYPSDDDAIPFN